MLELYLRYFRDHNWAVAVHNDYFLDGEFRTFWLFTHRCRLVYAKGEGSTDVEAVEKCIKNAASVDAKFAEDSEYIKMLAQTK